MPPGIWWPRKVRFNESDLRVARAVESRAAPLETKVSEVEQNAQRLSGQLDELAAVANTAKGGARAAQETADAAVSGVNLTNERISALDDYAPQTVAGRKLPQRQLGVVAGFENETR